MHEPLFLLSAGDFMSENDITRLIIKVTRDTLPQVFVHDKN
jgi:hypothetical protein